MKRLAIIGAGGAGKSWLAAQVGERLELSPINLDSLYYDPAWNPKPPDEWSRIQQRLVARDRWIIDGNYLSTIDIRLAAADTIVFLDTPTSRRLVRILARRVARPRQARPDVVGAERVTLGFLWYVANFNRITARA